MRRWVQWVIILDEQHGQEGLAAHNGRLQRQSRQKRLSSAVGLYGLGETNEAGEQLEDFLFGA